MSDQNLPSNQKALAIFSQDDCELITQEESSTQENLLDRLRELGVTSVKIKYSGSNDEGSVDGMDVSPDGVDLARHSSGATINVYNPDLGDDGGRDVVDISIEEALDSFTMDLIERLYPDFDSSDGAEGSLYIDVPTGQMILRHGIYVECTSHEPTEIESLADALTSQRFSFIEHRAIKPETVEALMAHAAKYGVANVHMEYSGCGDSGNPSELTATDANGKAVDVFEVFDAPDLMNYVRYNGSLEEAAAEAAKGNLSVIERENQVWIGRPRGTVSLGECLEAFFEVLADIKNPGYEINEGGGGSFSLDLKTNQLVVECYRSDTKSETFEHIFGAPGVAVIESRNPRLSHSMG